ncbi:winged helix DNA-binding domain-containing protein [Actinomadura scrupuli]|uniref:winged helix DNA-binding domain-containing protein n=1 Tax=Actinomadura scrupuli TaxID=559629 RepID=UPI003D95589C
MSDEIRHRRAHAQLLHRPGGGAAEVVRRLLAVQAQDIAAFPLALRARTAGLTAADVTAARDTREIVRCWGPRVTLHLIAAEDLPWLFPLVRPAPTGSLRRLRALGVEIGADEAVRFVTAALAGQGPLGKPELGERLAKAGLPAEGQAIVHLALLGAREGLVVLGPDRAGKPTYVHAADWLGRPLPVTVTDRDAALRRLARRYRLAHEPAEPADLAAWSGLSLGEARRAWPGSEPPPPAQTTPEHADLAQADLARAGSERADGGPVPVVRLVPGFDEYLLGWRTRELSVPGPYRTLIHPGGGIIRPALLVDGQAAGTWRTRRSARRVGIIVEPFEPLSPAVLAELQAEAADIGRFLGLPAEPTVIS